MAANAQKAASAMAWSNLFLFAVLIAASGTVLLTLQSHLTFFADDWRVLLDRRGWSVGDFLDPHNAHLTLAPVLIYKLLLVTFGMSSALPFEVVSTLVFLLSVALLFAYLRRPVGDWPALLGSALILFLGASWIDLLTAFPINFSGAIAAGLGALLALERDDVVADRIACALLVVSVSFSEVGVPFVAGAVVSILLRDWPRMRRLYIVFVPVVLYAVWWAGWGHTARGTFSLHNVLVSPKFVFDAASQAAASLLGLGTPLHASTHDPAASYRDPVGLDWGRILLVAGIGAAIWRFRRLGGVPRPFWVALAIGGSFWFLVAFYADPGLRTPTAGRYQYPGAVFLILIVAELLRWVWISRLALALGSAVTALAVLSGLWFFHLGYEKRLKPQSDMLRGELAAIEIAGDRVDPGLVVVSATAPIEAGAYLSAANAYGSPAYSESELASSREWVRGAADQVMVRGLGIRLGSETGSRSRSSGHGVTHCRTVAATSSGEPGVSLGPGEVTLRARPGASAEILLGRFADGLPVDLGPLARARTSSLTLPPDRSSRPWRLGLRGSGNVTVCEGRWHDSSAPVTAEGSMPESARTAVSEIERFRGRTTDAVELNSSTFSYAANTDWTQDSGETFRIRFQIQVSAGLERIATGQLEARYNAGSWFDVTTSSSILKAVASSQFNDGDATTDVLPTGVGPTTFTPGTGSETGKAVDVTLNNSHTEIEYVLRIITADVADGATIDVRVKPYTPGAATLCTLTVNIAVE
jgi:hypothetical protein